MMCFLEKKGKALFFASFLMTSGASFPLYPQVQERDSEQKPEAEISVAAADSPADSETAGSDGAEQDEPENIGVKNWLFAGAGVLTSNVTLALFNRFVRRADYAEVNGETIYDNLSNPWVWDQDTFVVNQLGHPYQGSFYFCAGRANGLSFYQSLACNLLGSVTWEYFCENERQAVNDLICTTFGGAAYGEVLHRLYIEAHEVHFPLAFIFSPMDALYGLITRKTQPRTPGDGITELEAFLSLGPVFEREKLESESTDRNTVVPVNFSGGCSLEYGNPFTCQKNMPYSFFTLDICGGGTKDYFAVSVRTEGLLHRFLTGYTDNARCMLGISMLTDTSWKKNTAFAANGLGLFFRSKAEYESGFSFDVSSDIHWILFGGNDYYKLYSGLITLPDDGVERRLYDYGTGFYTSCECGIAQKAFGRLKIKVMLQGMFTFENAVPLYGSNGFALIMDGGISYDHSVVKHFSLGISGNVYLKYGRYYSDDNVLQMIPSVGLYGTQKFK